MVNLKNFSPPNNIFHEINQVYVWYGTVRVLVLLDFILVAYMQIGYANRT